MNSPPKLSRSDQKHAQLLWAAARLFAKQGVGHTTTRQIAAEAQTTERTLFKHFESKEGLVQAVIAEAVIPHLTQHALADLKKLIGAKVEGLTAWHTGLLAARREAITANAELTRLLLMEILRDPKVREEFGKQWHEAAWLPLRSLFAKLQRDGILDKAYPPETLARIFLSLNLGYLISRIIVAPDALWHDVRDINDLAKFFTRGAAPN